MLRHGTDATVKSIADGRFYGFTVRCDRAQNAKIEKMAKAAKLTPNQFVQQHFELILSDPARSTAVETIKAEVERQVEKFPSMPGRADDILIWMTAKMDVHGEVLISGAEVQLDQRMASQTYYNGINHLTYAKKIKLVRRGSGGSPSIYAVLQPMMRPRNG